MSGFRIDQPFLSQMLKDIGEGKIQLPDFQRGWVWDDERIRSLIASVSQEFPIGSVLILNPTGTDVRFIPRLVKGVNSNDAKKDPDTFILDGQQRLTALYQALMSGTAVSTKDTKGREVLRHYYFNMEICINNDTDREQAVISCGEDHKLEIETQDENKKQAIDLSSNEAQYTNKMFPINKLFNDADWRQGYSKRWSNNQDKIDLLFKFEEKIIRPFNQYSIPVIELQEVPREAICKIFEKVNTGGVTLTVFELLTASLAAEDFQLREDWEIREERLKEHSVLDNLDNVNFLQVLTLLYTKTSKKTVSCKRDTILSLTRSIYEEYADRVEEGFNEAVRFLHEQKIFDAQDLPYNGQLVPLAAILADLNNMERNNLEVRKKLTQWYWCGVFGEMYSASTDTRFANDMSEVTNWIKESAEEPRTVHNAHFYENRLLELRTRSSAPYKGIYALLMHKEGCKDFSTRQSVEFQTYFDDNIDIHHIFPRSWCKTKGIDRNVYDSIINRTALSSRTNRRIGNKPPSQYLQEIEEDTDIYTSKMDEILDSHLICPDFLREDDFEGFFNARKEALIDAIEKVTDKKVRPESNDAVDSSEETM
ncbi:DUF262 domain-containing protein [Candidatus Poribacteria bacterium]|nr:DUF262 domain-containing protein [Candidatus Poribacteria bacterium]